MGIKPEKTNVMRLLDAAGIEYESRTYVESGAVSGVDVAKALGEDPDSVFKTLVTESKSGAHYVFVIPASAELDLKKAARASGEKAISMIRQKELLPLTGYVHGGCSPIGMKKPFPTFFDETAQLFDRIYFSAGKIGWQVGVNPEDARRCIGFEYADLTEE
ncbi:MAG: Cys-tRNA(Pro) deacylase [Oscillospiraceae bacterium]|nr:Cys-tRNA(Pro) deacylase [Oscillospiraceae bacterium]MBR0063421.1 Cys-tRNA(Pro) deacylase [Oscillospiraceae bacterium]